MNEVSHDVMQAYLNFEIDENGLFPANCKPGTRLEDLQPKDEDSAVCTLENISDLFEKFLDEDISFERFQSWIASMLDLDLFVFDNSKGDEAMDWMFDTLEYLSSFEDEDTILDKVDFTRLIDKAAEF